MPEWIRSPAKINLFLHVTGKRPDGYHELISLMCAISLFDTIEMDYQASTLSVTCDQPEVPAAEKNLAYKAAVLFFQKIGQPPNVSIHINKHIPIGGGLGGGSSNAASVIMALNRRYQHPIPMRELIPLTASIGADVPFFITGRPAVATGIGERLRPYALPLPFYAVLVYPGVSVSTAMIYKKLNLRLTKTQKKIRDFSFEDVGFCIAEHLCNDLETVTTSLFPVIRDVKDELMRHGAEGALMAGSGSTVFGLFSDFQAACKAFHALSRKTGWRCFLADLITDKQ